MLNVHNTKKFKKDLKKFEHIRDFMLDLKEIIERLRKDQPLEKRYRDHSLTGNWVNHRECHVKNDVLLIYKVDEERKNLFLERLGSHSELFR